MQLVPRTAGIDAYQRVHGEKRLVSAEFLFDVGNNIELGTAYINIVRDSYLRHIENPFSRFYCTVAAYNTGVGNVARTFADSGSLRSAAAQINGMSAEDVYRHLLRELPAEETRNYLRKIVSRIENYRHLDMG
jgi:membrane-bound lytic murein transglycosylase C